MELSSPSYVFRVNTRITSASYEHPTVLGTLHQQMDEAVAKARRERKVFVCFLYTEGVDSHAMSDALNQPPLRARLEAEAVTVALPDTADDSRASNYQTARQFR